MRSEARRLAFGLLTVLGLKKRGFFIPYRYAEQVPGRGMRQGDGAIDPVFAAAEPDCVWLLDRMDA